MKINYKIKDLLTAGPGSKWLVIQEGIARSLTGYVVTWSTKLLKEQQIKDGYSFLDDESGCAWRIGTEVRLATREEIKNKPYKE